MNFFEKNNPIAEIIYNVCEIQINEKNAGAGTGIYIENGDSGGPIFNDKAELIGINSFRLLDASGNPTYASSYAISIKEIQDFLIEN